MPTSQTASPLPAEVQQQLKTVEGTARSFFKGGMGVVLQSFSGAMNLAQQNAGRLLAAKAKRDGVSTQAQSEEDMRIDSDNIEYHVHPASSLLGTVGKIAGGALLGGALVGAPYLLPLASAAFNAVTSKPEAKSSDTKPVAPSVILNGKSYELGLKPDNEVEK